MSEYRPRRRPSDEELEAAWGKPVPDVIDRGLAVLFCGINPGLYSGAVGHHFARPGNRFWVALREARFTDRLLPPDEERELLRYGVGITNIVNRATQAASDLADDDLRRGAERLERKVRRYAPRYLAVVGIGAYRTGFSRPDAPVGEQPDTIGDTRIWVLPSTSGLNANYQLPDFVRLFSELREAAFEPL